MNVLRLVIATGAFVGTTLLLSRVPWFSRIPLSERIRPYSPGGMGRASRLGLLSVESFREVIAPLAQAVGARASGLLGVREDLARRLERIHADIGVGEFRLRQLTWSAGAGAASCALTIVLGFGVVASLPVMVGATALGYLCIEQRVASTASRWQRRTFLELPVVSEQLGMLLTAGYSLNAALTRVSRRGTGACSADLQVVVRRCRQGLSEVAALREWAARVDVEGVDRLVSVLARDHEATDLGRMVAEEARGIRRDVHRELIERIERRNQQVWIPVTVAALVPGVILMAVPFVDALSSFEQI